MIKTKNLPRQYAEEGFLRLAARSQPVEFGIVGVVVFRVYIVLRDTQGVGENDSFKQK